MKKFFLIIIFFISFSAIAQNEIKEKFKNFKEETVSFLENPNNGFENRENFLYLKFLNKEDFISVIVGEDQLITERFEGGKRYFSIFKMKKKIFSFSDIDDKILILDKENFDSCVTYFVTIVESK